jgi:hypothetical protein
LGPDGARAAVGSLAVAVGCLLLIVGNVLQLGGHQAVSELAEEGHTIETVNALHFTLDTVDDAFELFGFALLGVGVLALAWEALRQGERRVWAWFTAAVGVVILALAGAYAADNSDAINALLFLGGMVLLPVWLVWTAEGILRGTPAAVTSPASPS